MGLAPFHTEIGGQCKIRVFKPQFMSLTAPHPLWTTCGSNSIEINKAVVQARMLSGRYQTHNLAGHWTNNPDGLCLTPGCSPQEKGTLEHFLLLCSPLEHPRLNVIDLASKVAGQNPIVNGLLLDIINNQESSVLVQFLLDCSSMAPVIKLTQMYGIEVLKSLFHLSRSWCYALHRSRMNLLGLPQFI